MPTAETTTSRPASPPLTAAEKRKIVQLYTRRKNPLPIRAIAAEIGRAYTSVHRVLARSEGVVLRGNAGTRTKPKTSK